MSEPGTLSKVAGRVPQRWRRAVPPRLRNALVARLGHPAQPAPPFDPLAFPTRVNLGAGWDKRPGYLNVDLHDFHDPDLIGDVRSLPELPSGRYEEVIGQDILEHLERDDVPKTLAEWRRLLAPGGRLWLRVPDLSSLVRWLEKDDSADHHRQVMHFLFGTQAYTGDYHQTSFTGVLLSDQLHQAGFERVELEIRDEWLWEGEAFARAAGSGTPVATVWDKGFYQREYGHEDTTWRWGAREAALLLYAEAATSHELQLPLQVGNVTVSGAGVEATLTPGVHTLTLDLAAGANWVRFVADAALDLAEDPRELAFQLG